MRQWRGRPESPFSSFFPFPFRRNFQMSNRYISKRFFVMIFSLLGDICGYGLAEERQKRNGPFFDLDEVGSTIPSSFFDPPFSYPSISSGLKLSFLIFFLFLLARVYLLLFLLLHLSFIAPPPSPPRPTPPHLLIFHIL